MQRIQKGFTLIELLVVIAIIGILATLVITQLGGARGKARNASVRSDVAEAGKSVEAFKNDEVAAERIINTGTTALNYISMDSAGAQVTTGVGGVVTGAITTYFLGVQNTGATGVQSYATKYLKTPGAGYTYKYTATGAAVGSMATASTDAAAGANSYTFCGNLVSDLSAGFVAVTNGSLGTGGAVNNAGASNCR